MALTPQQRKQIIDAAYKAHAEGRPLFPSLRKTQAEPARKSDDELRKMKWEEMTESERSDAMAMQIRRLTPPWQVVTQAPAQMPQDEKDS